MLLAAIVLVASGVAYTTRAEDLLPIQAKSLRLGDINGVAYYTVQGHGYHLIATSRPHIGLHGPVEYSHAELAKVVGKVLGKSIVFEQMEMMEFIKMLGFENGKMKKHHIQSVRIDQQEGLLRGTDDIGTRIIGRPLMTIEEFINENRSLLS